MNNNVKVILDESQFGSIYQDPNQDRWSFYFQDKDGNLEFITSRKGSGVELVAVSKKQYNSWKNKVIVAKLEKM